MIGDFNGDGLDDIATFLRGSSGQAYVALSNGSSFGARTLWHNGAAVGNELPDVGDAHGDGRDDIITFHRGDSGDVYVALSNGSQFLGTGVLWHTSISFRNDLPQPTCIIGPIVF